ncbi:MAG: hypothetical protein MRERV_4c091 [Mycoplasmataceae bacterium RV_VA103A]|nr:MAG: hypothetical protein MRERV_11c047 [Mycoplasmataceae bacterium RV_VA103A]KLL05182.1 MAG: hypothetical protein MRERV_4c091 [Mycoplasmataceae bacterium RV_VA103A]
MFNVDLQPLIKQIELFTQAQEKTNNLLKEIKEILSRK